MGVGNWKKSPNSLEEVGNSFPVGIPASLEDF